MTRRVTVTQAEIARAVKGAKAAGLSVERVEIDTRTGMIVVYPSAAKDLPAPPAGLIAGRIKRMVNG